MTKTAAPEGPLVDFHCHVDLYDDHEGLIAESDRLGIYTLAVTTTPKAWGRNRELAARSRFVRVALGLHPQLVAERAGEISLWRDLLREARYVGEVGLDAGPRFFRSFEQQKEIFVAILRECALLGGKILSVHSVRSVKSVLDLVETYLPTEGRRLVLHWFTGTIAEARRAVDLGCYFSINAEMLNNNRGRALVAALPIDRLLTETDGPFTKKNGVAARPGDVGAVVTSIAAARQVSSTTMRDLVARNLRTLVEVG
jgi:TatD DNase family protein